MGLQVGDQVGDYRVIGILGAGGMGAVYQVRHLISDRLEAMKVLLPDLASCKDLAERFIREIRLQASLSHPNIAGLHNAFHYENQLLMVMEFIQGDSLAEIIRHGPLKIPHAIQVGTQVLSALSYAHQHGVIHRDIKPSNIMQRQDGTVKLLDFGIARGTTDASSLTQTGMAVGSFYYMSPEQIRAETVGPQSDLYSTGVMFFEMLVGQRPFQGSAATVLHAHLEKDPPLPAMLNPSIPESLSLLVRKALEKQTAARFKTADEFRDALVAVQKSLGAEIASPVWAPADIRAEAPTLPLKAEQTPPAHTTNKRVLFDPIGLERLRKEIAPHIGPLAKVIVDRAAKRCQSWDELYKTLARELPAGKERDRFLLGKPSQ